jgi:predicted transcriptional regulator
MGSLTIRLDPKLDRDLTRLAKAQGRAKSEVAHDILRRSIAVELFEEARRRLRPYAGKAGYLTDEDIFWDFS